MCEILLYVAVCYGTIVLIALIVPADIFRKKEKKMADFHYTPRVTVHKMTEKIEDLKVGRINVIIYFDTGESIIKDFYGYPNVLVDNYTNSFSDIETYRLMICSPIHVKEYDFGHSRITHDNTEYHCRVTKVTTLEDNPEYIKKYLVKRTMSTYDDGIEQCTNLSYEEIKEKQ